ncbi:MAG TPA: type II secretion system protein G [Burkholderiales bacterium]
MLAILALLVSIAAPRYFAHVDRAKEAALKQDLSVMRDAIDKFYGDKGRYPTDLAEMVSQRYLRSVPVDPLTESAGTWITLPPPPEAQAKGEVYDVKSGAEGTAADGSEYREW